jgi:hypothetical protein
VAFSSVYSQADWATREHFAPKVQDVVLNSNATTAILRQNMKLLSGGRRIESFANYKLGTSGGFVSKSATLTANFEQKFDAAFWSWKYLTEPIGLYIPDILMNSGEDARFDLVMNENITAAKTLANNFGSALYSLNYTNSTGDHIDSLDHSVNNQTGTTDETGFTATYAGVPREATGDRATWNANVDDATAAFTTGAANDLWLDCTEGSDMPTVWSSNNAGFGFFYDELTPIQRQDAEVLTGKMGFTAAVLNGAPWVVDSHCPSTARVVPGAGLGFGTAPTAAEYVYALNTNYIQIEAHQEAAFSYWGTKEPTDQWSVIGRYWFMGNVTNYNPRFSGKMSALTA